MEMATLFFKDKAPAVGASWRKTHNGIQRWQATQKGMLLLEGWFYIYI